MAKRNITIGASLMAADYAALGPAAHQAELAGVEAIHLDYFDGHYAHNLSFGLELIPALRRYTNLPLVAHLMLANLDAMLPDFGSATEIIACEDNCPDLEATLAAMQAGGVRPGLALNVGRPLERVLPYLPRLDELLILAVTPGWGGQRFDPRALPLLRAVRAEIDRLGLDTVLSIDGGVNPETIPAVIAAGADRLVIGTSVFRGDVAANVRALREMFARSQDTQEGTS